MAIILHGANGARTVTQTIHKREPENVKALRAEGSAVMVTTRKSENVVRIFSGRKCNVLRTKGNLKMTVHRLSHITIRERTET